MPPGDAVADMTATLRVFFVGGMISYRALFNWIRPEIYIPTMLGSPVFQILFFAYLGRFAGLRDDAFFVVGNAVQVCSMASIYGATMAIGNERWMGTLPSLLASPANRIALFLGRSLPYIANGIFISIFGFTVGLVFLDFQITSSQVLPLLATVGVTVVSCTSFGLMLGSIGLRARDVFFISNVLYYLMLLFCGVNIPLADLPGWMQAIGTRMPLTHGIIAARAIASGRELAGVWELVRAEVLIGAIYAVIAYGLFRFFEQESRRRATLETH